MGFGSGRRMRIMNLTRRRTLIMKTHPDHETYGVTLPYHESQEAALPCYDSQGAAHLYHESLGAAQEEEQEGTKNMCFSCLREPVGNKCSETRPTEVPKKHENASDGGKLNFNSK